MQLKKILRKVKRRLLDKPYIKDPRYPAYWMDEVLGKKEALLVQIGSNDGKTGDPLYQLFNKNTTWKGLFVEPVPYLFERLQANYPDVSRFSFENAAINEGQDLDFYWVDPDAVPNKQELPFWYDQLGSFNKDHILNALDGQLAPYIVSAKLEGITLDTLFERHGVAQFDVLHIDAEGYDWVVLQQLDLQRFQPSFILYEHSHLSKEDLQSSIDFLKKDYHVYRIGIDLLAVKKGVEADLPYVAL